MFQPHLLLMREALALAAVGASEGEVPVGALVVIEGQVRGRGYNRPIGASDPTAHAEIVAMREAAAGVGNYRLPGATLYVTIEPCLMCLGAMMHARIGTLVYGAAEPKAGAIESTLRGPERRGPRRPMTIVSGVLARECADALQTFFAGRRGGRADPA
jgi:tRNA(adenine34) deaminase